MACSCCTPPPPALSEPLLEGGTKHSHGADAERPQGAPPPSLPPLPAALAADADEQQIRQRVRESAARFCQQAAEARQRANWESAQRLQQLEADARRRAGQRCISGSQVRLGTCLRCVGWELVCCCLSTKAVYMCIWRSCCPPQVTPPSPAGLAAQQPVCSRGGGGLAAAQPARTHRAAAVTCQLPTSMFNGTASSRPRCNLHMRNIDKHKASG